MASSATQEFIPIKEIRDGIVILKDGGMRAILMTSSLNFALRSQEEQQSIIYQFQNFLNSLDFSILLYFWKTNPPYKNLYVDINKDNKVTSVDFSIMLSQWTGRKNY
jgi:hypothetical protein